MPVLPITAAIAAPRPRSGQGRVRSKPSVRSPRPSRSRSRKCATRATGTSAVAMPKSCQARSSQGRPGAAEALSVAAWSFRPPGLVTDPTKLISADTPLAPSESARTSSVSSRSIRRESPSREKESATCPASTCTPASSRVNTPHPRTCLARVSKEVETSVRDRPPGGRAPYGAYLPFACRSAGIRHGVRQGGAAPSWDVTACPIRTGRAAAPPALSPVAAPRRVTPGPSS